MSRHDPEHHVREALRGISFMTLLAVTTGAAAAIIATVVLIALGQA